MVVLAGAAVRLVEAAARAKLVLAEVEAQGVVAVRRLGLETAGPLVEAEEAEVEEELTTAAETPVAAELVAAHAVLVLLQTTVVSTVLQRRVLQVIRVLAVAAIRSATSAASASRADLMTMIKLISSAALGMAAPAIVPMERSVRSASPATRTVNAKVMTADAWNAVLVVGLVRVVNSPKSKPACHIAAVLCPGRTPAWLNAEPLFLKHVMRYALLCHLTQSSATATAMTSVVTARSATLQANAFLIQDVATAMITSMLNTSARISCFPALLFPPAGVQRATIILQATSMTARLAYRSADLLAKDPTR